MGMGQEVVTGIGQGGITCVLQTQFPSLFQFCKRVMHQQVTLHKLTSFVHDVFISLSVE